MRWRAPSCAGSRERLRRNASRTTSRASCPAQPRSRPPRSPTASSRDRKSTRLNSSHLVISYAVFCLKKKKKQKSKTRKEQDNNKYEHKHQYANTDINATIIPS